MDLFGEREAVNVAVRMAFSHLLASGRARFLHRYEIFVLVNILAGTFLIVGGLKPAGC